MKIEEGAPIVAVPGVDRLYHLPAPTRITRHRGGRYTYRLERALAKVVLDKWPTLCGLEGDMLALGGPMRDRKCCTVCAARNQAAALLVTGEYALDYRAPGPPRAPKPTPAGYEPHGMGPLRRSRR